MLDFTPEAQLTPPWHRRYTIARLFLWTLFIIGTGAGAYIFFFPTQPFSFSFQNPNSKSNSVLFVENSQKELPKNGKITKGDVLSFDTFSPQSFSQISARITLSKRSSVPAEIPIEVKKSYKAFSYPRSQKIVGFKDGTLIENKGLLFIVSEGKLRNIPDQKIMAALGYNSNQFTRVEDNEISANPLSDEISDPKNYPNGTTFQINNDFYELRNGKLQEYISEKAFRANRDKKYTIQKDNSFFEKYPISNERLGFPSGALLSFNNAVYIVSDDLVMPFDNEITFLSMGFSWDDVILASEEEIRLYKKSHLFSISDPHPSGTIFVTDETGAYFLVADGTLREIKGKNILDSYRIKSPVLVSEKGLIEKSDCILTKTLWPPRTFTCALDIKNLDALNGNDFQFKSAIPEDIDIDSIAVTFSTKIDWFNLRDTLSNIKHKIQLNYGLTVPK